MRRQAYVALLENTGMQTSIHKVIQGGTIMQREEYQRMLVYTVGVRGYSLKDVCTFHPQPDSDNNWQAKLADQSHDVLLEYHEQDGKTGKTVGTYLEKSFEEPRQSKTIPRTVLLPPRHL